jgi:predicted RNase H-like HicB family nuclease
VKYRIVLEQDEDGVFVAEAPALPGCVTQGDTREQALANAREAVELYLESLRENGEPGPPPMEEATIEVSA